MAGKEPYRQEVSLLDTYLSGQLPESTEDPPSERVHRVSRSPETSRIFPFGVYGSFVFNLPRMVFRMVDEPACALLERKPAELQDAFFPRLLSSMVVAEHRGAAFNLANRALEWVMGNRDADAVVNLECHVTDGQHGHKRLLFQVHPRSFHNDGHLLEVEGYVVDISHMLRSGPPRLSIFSRNQLALLETGSLEDIIKHLDLPLTPRDISVLTLKNRGLRVKEIAQELHMQELSIYSIFRDIKKKTGMELFPLISMLKDKGLV